MEIPHWFLLPVLLPEPLIWKLSISSLQLLAMVYLRAYHFLAPPNAFPPRLLLFLPRRGRPYMYIVYAPNQVCLCPSIIKYQHFSIHTLLFRRVEFMRALFVLMIVVWVILLVRCEIWSWNQFTLYPIEIYVNLHPA